MKTITVTKRSVEVPVLHLRRGDTDSSLVRVRIPKEDGSQDIGLMTWSVNIRNMGCEMYASFIGLPVEEDDTQIMLEWKIPKCVACVPGVSFVEFCGIRQEEGVVAAVWKSGVRHIEVHCDLPEPVLTEEEYFTVQQFIGEISQQVSQQLYTYQGEMDEMDHRLGGAIEDARQDISALEEQTGGDLDEIREQLNADGRDIAYLNDNAVTKNENYIKKEPFGTKWNASVLNLHGDYKNMENGGGLVNGLDNSRKEQATYSGSDAAGECIVMGTREIADEFTAKVTQYGATHCIVSDVSTGFWDRVKVNSVIHCYRTDGLEALPSPTEQDRYNAMYGSDRYIGIVTGFDREENKIIVNCWVKFNDLSAGGQPPAGQIPNDPYKNIVVDPIRKVWGQNINLFVRNPKNGVVCEAGLWGESPKKEGYDVVLYTGAANYGFRTRKISGNTTGTMKAGFIDQGSDESFRSESPKEAALACYLDSEHQNVPVIKANMSALGTSFTLNARGHANMEGAEINTITGMDGATGAVPKKFYATTAAGTALRLSDAANGSMTAILARHDVTLKGTMRIDSGNGFKNATEVLVKAGQIVRCVFYNGWHLTSEPATKAAENTVAKAKVLSNTHSIPSVPQAETYVITGASYDITIENGVQNGDKCSLLMLSSGTVRLLGSLRVKGSTSTGFAAADEAKLKRGAKIDIVWFNNAWYMTSADGFAPEV